ncbi:hypothetical protein MHU86_22256 [Fragilaria crotonensis]|nr:hypothetical protein MHU86_22256 [Fragilaria crotonensis]
MVDTKTLNKYKCVLASFMSFIHGRSVDNKYDRDYVHSVEALAAVTPQDVVRYMNVKTFGTLFPSPDSNPLSRRGATLGFDKKAISFFMPNREKWSVTRSEGNPTQSQDVNALIKRVKKKEARKQGAESKTKRPMVGAEFVAMHDILKKGAASGRTTTHATYWQRYGIGAMVNFQFHLIARVDDSTQVVLEHIRVHDSFPHALKTRLNWSKNVQDERDAPWQIVLGALNPVYCVLCSLGLWLELNIKMHPPALDSPYVFCFTDDNRIPEGGQKAKAKIQKILAKMFKLEEFQTDNGEAKSLLLGSHSIRKYAATFARRCGVTKDEKDIRGRWKGTGRVSDVYDDVELPYPDAKVAEKLCGGGACFYLPNPRYDTVMMNSFILNHVVPNVKKRLPESACLVLGRALMWLICSPMADEFVPADMKETVLADWAHVRGTNQHADADTPANNGRDNDEDEINPIQQVAVTVSGDHGAVFIDTIGDLEGEGARGVGHQQGTNATVRNQLIGVQSCLLSMRQENLELKNAMNSMKVNMERSFQMVNGNIRRLAMRPVRNLAAATATMGQQEPVPPQQQQDTAAGGDHAMMLATLMPTPRSLHDLWQEYQHGVGGRKAARLFSHSERGRSKHRYHRRKIVWDLIAGLVMQGHTADAGIDRIYAVYGGQTSVTNIINGLKRDRKSGTLSPNLRI